jgi:hypothetical protein
MDRQQLDFLLGFQRAATLVNNVLTSPASYAAGRDYLEDVALLHADSEDLMRRGLAVGCLSALGK